jgi:hypothetical protein
MSWTFMRHLQVHVSPSFFNFINVRREDLFLQVGDKKSPPLATCFSR